MAITVTRIGDIKNQLGEGPLWDPVNEVLYWVDSKAGYVHCISPIGESIRSWPVHQMIGSLALREAGGAILALANGLHTLDFDSGEISPLLLIEEEDERTRFNDGKTDRQGNFLVGTMGVKIRDRALSSLYRLAGDLSIKVLEDDVIVSNGPCFSPDGKCFYFNDGRRRILAYDYAPESGELANKRVFMDGTTANVSTDGVTVDAEGHLWAALIGSSAVGCFDLNGNLVKTVKVPVNLPSSVMFGGPDLDILYVTSISDSGNRVSFEAGAGGLYQIKGLGVQGLPEMRFTG